MTRQVFAGGIGALLMLQAAVATAQPAPTPGPATHPFSIGGSGGLSAGSMTAGASVGGSLAFDVAERVTLEGRGLWLQRGGGASGFEASGTMLFTVFRGEKAAPYVAIGGGLYRARFDMGSRQMFGRGGMPFAPGSTLVPSQTFGGSMMGGGSMSGGAMWTGIYGGTFETREMPMFYASRLGQMMAPPDGRWERRSFTDPAITLGVGLTLDLTERVYVRPDLRTLVVFGNGNALTLGTATVGFGVRF